MLLALSALLGPVLPVEPGVASGRSVLAPSAAAGSGVGREGFSLGPPYDCPDGMKCLVQQMLDLDPGKEARDPFCGSMTYDGHKGTDFRVPSMRDVARGVPVIAMAAGTVKAARDGMADHLVRSPEDRAAVADRECGNGVIIDHGGGLETQYCHMRESSILVRPGMRVEKADMLGMVGASGMAAFPHVHVSLRKDGREIDPATGLAPGNACLEPGAAGGGSLDEAAQALLPVRDMPALLGAGFAPGPVDDTALADNGPPPAPDRAAPALTGYVWVINLKRGDRVRIRVERDGAVFAENLSEPVDRNKAVYTAFAGRRGNPEPGRYTLMAAIVRDGADILAATERLDID